MASGRPATDVRQAAAARQREAQAALERYAADPGGADLAVRPDQSYWTQRQESALSALGVKHATYGDMQMYLHVCNRTRLDPFLKQIYMICRREWDPLANDGQGGWVWKQTIQVGIDGFRVQRERAADDGGFMVDFEETIWYDESGGEHMVWLTADPPAAVKVVLVKVYADGQRLRYPAVIRYAAYVPRKDGKPNPTGRWKDDPDHQLEKCAEAFASRRACPADLGGLYITEEMGDGALGEAEPGNGGQPAPRRRPSRNRPVQATVVSSGPADPGPPPGDPEGPDPDLEERRAAAQRRIHAMFSGVGHGGDDAHDVRVAVLSALAREEGASDLVALESTSDLDVWQAERAAAALQQFISAAAADKDRNPRDALAQLAASVAEAREQAKPKPGNGGNGGGK